MRKVRVFIVEDSILMQKVIGDILSSEPQIEVVGSTKLGREALQRIPELKPDVVTLDVNLPDISGLKVLEELMHNFPTRVVMLSAYTQRGAKVTMKALELGALDFIPKPSGEVSLDLYNFREEIISKIKLTARVDLNKFLSLTVEKVVDKEKLAVKKIVAIGASTGGPKAILDLMQTFPSYCDYTFLIIQHMPPGFTRSFAERLSWYSNIKIKEAEDGDFLIKGAGFVAPSGYHMMIEKALEGYCIRLDETALVNYVRPAIDVTLTSLAEVFDGEIVVVILTGMGKDGLEGARKVKEKGGRIIAQDEASCVVYGMPRAVIEAKLADEILPVSKIPDKILEYLKDG